MVGLCWQECKAAQNQILKEFLQQVHRKKQQVSVLHLLCISSLVNVV